MKQLTDSIMDELAQQAKASPRLRGNFNLHEELSDPVQRLAIAMEPDTHVRPHRHSQTWEVLTALSGRFIVLQFDEAGTVTSRAVLGEGCQVIELPAGAMHAVLSLDEGGVIFEVKQGPYAPLQSSDYAAWAGTGEGESAHAMNAWYARAQLGDRFGVS